MKWNYIIIPLAVIAVSLIGGRFTSAGMAWYKTIRLPGFTPAGFVIGIVWTVIFTLCAVCLLLLWNKGLSGNRVWVIVALFTVNGLLNILWSYLFFTRHAIGWAVAEAALLDATVIILIILIWPLSRLAAALLIPYAAWTAFAAYLTYSVWRLN